MISACRKTTAGLVFDLGGALATRCKNPVGRSSLKVMRGVSCRGVSRVCSEMLEVFRSDLLLHLPGSSKRMAGGIRLIEGMENAAAMHESSAPFGWKTSARSPKDRWPLFLRSPCTRVPEEERPETQAAYGICGGRLLAGARSVFSAHGQSNL